MAGWPVFLGGSGSGPCVLTFAGPSIARNNVGRLFFRRILRQLETVCSLGIVPSCRAIRKMITRGSPLTGRISKRACTFRQAPCVVAPGNGPSLRDPRSRMATRLRSTMRSVRRKPLTRSGGNDGNTAGLRGSVLALHVAALSRFGNSLRERSGASPAICHLRDCA